MGPDYDLMLDNLTSSYLEATESDDFFKQLKLARDTAIIRLLKLGLSLREVAGLDAGQIKRLPAAKLKANGTASHCIELIRDRPVRVPLDPVTVKSLHQYLMLRGSQKRTIFLRIKKQTPISHTDIVMLLKEARNAISGQSSKRMEQEKMSTSKETH
jgi:integrase